MLTYPNFIIFRRCIVPGNLILRSSNALANLEICNKLPLGFVLDRGRDTTLSGQASQWVIQRIVNMPQQKTVS